MVLLGPLGTLGFGPLAFGSALTTLGCGAFGALGGGCIYGVSGTTAIGVSRIGNAICGVGDGDDTFMGAGDCDGAMA